MVRWPIWRPGEPAVAQAIAAAVRAIDAGLAILAISGSCMEAAAREAGLTVFSEIFADRGYLASGQLVPRGAPGAMIDDPAAAVARLTGFLKTGRMPVTDGAPIALAAQSVCVHGDSPARSPWRGRSAPGSPPRG